MVAAGFSGVTTCPDCSTQAKALPGASFATRVASSYSRAGASAPETETVGVTTARRTQLWSPRERASRNRRIDPRRQALDAIAFNCAPATHRLMGAIQSKNAPVMIRHVDLGPARSPIKSMRRRRNACSGGESGRARRPISTKLATCSGAMLVIEMAVKPPGQKATR